MIIEIDSCAYFFFIVVSSIDMVARLKMMQSVCATKFLCNFCICPGLLMNYSVIHVACEISYPYQWCCVGL